MLEFIIIIHYIQKLINIFYKNYLDKSIASFLFVNIIYLRPSL